MDAKEQPPVFAIEQALVMAKASPCAKSKRGAALYFPFHDGQVIIGRGFNGQPDGFPCTGSASCRSHCRMICQHAEARAIMDAMQKRSFDEVVAGVPLAELVHVKAVDGKLVAGGGPSCVQCSRLIVDVGFIAGVWLYEAYVSSAPGPQLSPSGWFYYTAADFHRVTLHNLGIEV